MPNDHFVAQTYLKHWCDLKTNMLHGYSKTGDKEFPCRTQDVCRHWDWDRNPLFTDTPTLLADFKRIFEPAWNPTVTNVRMGRLSSGDKFALAGFWAVLTTCTPAWHRNAVQLVKHQIIDLIPVAAKKVAKKHPEHRDYLDKALADGRIGPNVDENHVKAMLTKSLLDTAFRLYQLDWTIIENATKVPFITSDNPSSVLPRRAIMDPLCRFLPLGPHLAIMTVMDRSKVRDGFIPDLSKPAPGSIRRGLIKRKKAAAKLNRVTVMNADQHVFSLGMNRGARRLVRCHRDFGPVVEHAKFPTPTGHISASTLMIRRKKTGPVSSL